VTIAVLLLPPVVDPIIQPTPLTPFSAAAFAAMAVIAFFVALRRPAWAMALLAFAIPFAFYRDIMGTTLTFEKVVIVGVAMGLVVRGAPLVPASASARRIMLAALGVLATTMLSGIGATHLWPVAREALKLVEYVVMFWCAASLVIECGDDTRWLEGGVIAATSLVALAAVSQALFGGAPSGVWVNDQPLPRVAGPLEGPNQLAGYLETALPLLILSPLLLGRSFATLRWIAIAAVMMALVLSQSRSGIAVAILGYGIAWLLDRRSARQALLPFVVGTCAGLSIALFWYWGATHDVLQTLTGLFRLVLPRSPGGVGTRNELWVAAWTLFAQHPLLGVGAGNFEFMLPSVGLPNVQTHANSLWLQTLAEQGLLGFTALIVLVAVVLRENIAGLRQSWLSQAAFIATVCLLLHQVFDDLLFFPKIGLLWWLLLGAAAGAMATATSTAKARPATASAELREHATPVA
jgi:O-antigen ligase